MCVQRALADKLICWRLFSMFWILEPAFANLSLSIRFLTEWTRAGGEASPTRRAARRLGPSQLPGQPLAQWASGAQAAHATRPSEMDWPTALDQSSSSLQPLVAVDNVRRGLHQAARTLLQGQAKMWTHKARGAAQVLAVSANCG